MPILFFLSIAVAVFFAIHSVRSGQGLYWLFILFIFPFLGSLVYFFAIYLPSSRYSLAGYHIENKLRDVLDPNRELREALTAFEISPTVDAHLRLADAYMNCGQPDKAIYHYQNALTHVYRNAPDILLRYANALFQTKQFSQAKETLEQLRTANPNYNSNEGHLLYTKILVELDEKQAAKEEFNSLLGYYPSLEAAVFYIATLIRWQAIDEAKQFADEISTRIKHLPKHAKQMNAQWIKEFDELKTKLQ